MLVKNFFRELTKAISEREDTLDFAMKDIYMLNDIDEHEDLEVGETLISITGNLAFEK